MTKFDKELLHNFGNTYHALASTDVPFSTRKQLVDDLWDKIQAELATPPQDTEPDSDPNPAPPGPSFRIYKKNGDLWSENYFLSMEAARRYLFANPYLVISDNPLSDEYYRKLFSIREEPTN